MAKAEHIRIHCDFVYGLKKRCKETAVRRGPGPGRGLAYRCADHVGEGPGWEDYPPDRRRP